MRAASPADASEVLDILDEACRWLESRGVQQWPEHFEYSWIEPALTRGETWLASSGGPAVATITLSWADSAWSPDDENGGYLHRLAVRRASAGLGALLLDWAEVRCLNRGRRYLRLDCVSTNSPLRRYYEKRGFHHQRDVVVVGPPTDREQCQVSGRETTVSLYEMDLHHD